MIIQAQYICLDILIIRVHREIIALHSYVVSVVTRFPINKEPPGSCGCI